MIGRRLQDNLTHWNVADAPRPGDYWKTVNGWMCCAPNGSYGNLSRHDITEHPDGTITVSPSILISRGAVEEWHGFLERGIWRSC